jgi:hypothetical protein
MITVGRMLATAVLVASFFFSAAQANATVSDDMGSVGVISSVNGEARITHSTAVQQSDQPTFHGPIIYGDHLSTSKDSTLGLLVGQNSLLTMRELSDVRIAETVRNRQILEMVSGRVCLAVGQPAASTTEPLMLRTPTTMVTAAPGTLFSVDVTEAPQKSALQSGTSEELVTLIAMTAQVAKGGTAPVVETYQVVEGSIDIVSLASGSSSISLHTGQSLRVAGGVIGQAFVAPPVNCRAQDIQIIPPHTTIPVAAQRMLVQQQLETAATESVAAMSQPSAGQSPSGTLGFNGVIIPTTTVDPSLIPASTRTTISVRLP